LNTRTRRTKVQAPKLRRSSNGMILTPEEFDAVRDFDDRYDYELIRGVLIVSPIPSEMEAGPVLQLCYMLLSYQEGHPRGSSLDATLTERYIAVPDGRRRADCVIWAGLGRLPDPSKDVPTIAVEFVSKSRRDRVRDYEEKRREYLALGVAEYWIIDRFRRVLTVYRQPPAEPAEQVIAADGTYRTPLLPGFGLPMARLLKVADDWKATKKSP